jgi:hypothetical protein
MRGTARQIIDPAIVMAGLTQYTHNKKQPRPGKHNPQGATWGLNGKKSSGKPEFIFLLLYYVKSNLVIRRSLDEKEVAR